MATTGAGIHEDLAAELLARTALRRIDCWGRDLFQGACRLVLARPLVWADMIAAELDIISRAALRSLKRLICAK